MPIQFGNNKISEVYFGGNKIKEVYYGSQLVYKSGPDYMFLWAVIEGNNIVIKASADFVNIKM